MFYAENIDFGIGMKRERGVWEPSHTPQQHNSSGNYTAKIFYTDQLRSAASRDCISSISSSASPSSDAAVAPFSSGSGSGRASVTLLGAFPRAPENKNKGNV